ncbi:MAG: DNA translocase FtsK [Clostridiales bacterium]|nr:DNA translocase FtsK [Clostridiales bacterium]
MAASKSGKNRKKTSTRKKSGASSGNAASFQNDIILLIILAACIILMASDFGMGGIVGNTISKACFGVMGLMAYAFPVLLFIAAAFLISNHTNPLAYKKVAAGIVFFACMCGLLQLLTAGYQKSSTFSDYFAMSSNYHTGGGVIGGALCISTISAFGTVGAYVILVMVMMVCLIILTQRSFFGFLNRIADGLAGMARDSHDVYEEGRSDRDKMRELKSRQKRKKREERRAEKIRRLEEAIEAEEEALAAESGKESAKGGKRTAKSRKTNSGSRKKTGGKTAWGEDTFEQITLRPGKEPEKKSPSGKTAAEGTGDVLTFETGESGNGQMEFHIHREKPAPEPEEEEFFTVSVEDSPEKKKSGEEKEAAPGEKTRGSVKNPRSSQKDIEGGIRNIQHEIDSRETEKEYRFPDLKLLKRGSGKTRGDSDEYLRKTAQKLQDTLHSFGVNVTVTNICCGPTVTQYELQPEVGVKVSRIVSLADDIKLNLATPDIRIEAPIPGKAAVGIEVPNKEYSPVLLRDLLESREFKEAKSKVSFAVGKNIEGKPIVADIAKMPHLLIAGATGSGKSVCINTLIISILYKARPDEVKLIMIDPKVVELSVYNGIPHLLIPVVTDPKKAAGALNWAVSEMTNRYNTFAQYGVRNVNEYRKKIETLETPEGEEPPARMPQIVIIVDELADLMMVAPGEVEDAICRLAQLARAAGIHLIIATQRPSVNVITGLIKANMPSRIAFAVSSGVDSRTILDMNGAEKLLGKGDMLFYPQGYPKPARLQGALVSDEEVSQIVRFLADRNPAAEYSPQIESQMNSGILSPGSGTEERDVYFEEAGKFIIEKEKASIGMLQRMFKVGFNRAARIMDQLCDAGVVGPEEGTKPRKVLMTAEEFQAYMEDH